MALGDEYTPRNRERDLNYERACEEAARENASRRAAALRELSGEEPLDIGLHTGPSGT